MKALGYTEKISALIELSKLDGFELGRVIIEHRERYTVQTEKGISSAEITGNLRFTAESRRDFPAVGDWVKLAMMDSEHSIILEVLPRFSTLERKAVGKESEIQIIASNIDTAFIVQAVGYDFNLKRIERYLAICRTSDIEPVIILTKIDLIDSKKIEELCDKISSRLEQLKVIPLSSISGLGFNELENHFEKYKTYCFLGSSGVGKSTIVNKLKGEEILKTTSISDSNSKGKHTTSHRELIILPNESIVIDTPGMRELGMSESAKGIERTYDQIEVLSSECMFNDCTHTNEKGCAVLKALESNELSIDVFENYKKLKREQEHFSSSVSERRKKGKAQAKLYRSVLEQRKKTNFNPINVFMNQAQQLEKKHHFQVYNRYPITIDHGLGARVWDTKGNEYIDILGGIAVNNLGHCHPKIVEAIRDQAGKLLHVSNFYYTEPQSEFVERLAKLSGLDRVFLCNSGMEAMEACVKLARKWGKAQGKSGDIISLSNGFHGRSVTTITMGKPIYQEGFDPLPPGFRHSPYNEFKALQEAVNDQTIAIAFEPIQGNSGVNIPDPEFFLKVRQLCNDKNILLILDEVQTGIGRTGKFWAFEHFGIQPDVVAAAKALGSGIPIGAVMAKEEVASALSFGNHGTTFGGNPFACAVGNATLKTIEEEGIIEQTREKGTFMINLIREKTQNIKSVIDIRGLGLMIGVELNKPARPVVEKMFEHRILSNATGNVIRIVPPLVITKVEIEQVVETLVKSLG